MTGAARPNDQVKVNVVIGSDAGNWCINVAFQISVLQRMMIKQIIQDQTQLYAVSTCCSNIRDPKPDCCPDSNDGVILRLRNLQPKFWRSSDFWRTVADRSCWGNRR